MNFLIVILAIVVLLLTYYIYTIVTAVPVVGKNIDLTQLPVSVKSSSITNPYSANYTIGVWIYISNFTSNNKVGAFLMYGKADNRFFLEMDANTPDVYCNIKTTANTTGSPSVPIYQRIKINNAGESFPVQSWTYVTVSVSSTFIECYINGRFVSATKSNSIFSNDPGTGEAKDAGPAFTFGAKGTTVTRSSTTAGVTTIATTNASDIRIEGSPIFLTGLSRWDNPLSSGDIYNNYMKGNGYSNIWGSPYHMDVNLKKGTDNYVMNIF